MEAERRQVTVLFADMVGFTTFSERSGEEAAFTLMQSLQKLMEDAVHDQGGVVQGYTGDGIMAVFGAPVAYEDAPLRVCRAALEILRRLKAIGGDLSRRRGPLGYAHGSLAAEPAAPLRLATTLASPNILPRDEWRRADLSMHCFVGSTMLAPA